MRFEYLFSRTALEDIEIEAIGNCALECFTDKGEVYYLIVKTDLGITQFYTQGPTIPDIDMLPSKVNVSYSRFGYSESKIIKAIEKFLANPDITQVMEIDIDEALTKCSEINIAERMRYSS